MVNIIENEILLQMWDKSFFNPQEALEALSIDYKTEKLLDEEWEGINVLYTIQFLLQLSDKGLITLENAKKQILPKLQLITEEKKD